MPRNAEVIRQWTILREVEQARGVGLTIDQLAPLCGVTTRTIRRDLQALEEAGFPLFDDRSHEDGRTRWKLNGQALRGLAAGPKATAGSNSRSPPGRSRPRCTCVRPR